MTAISIADLNNAKTDVDHIAAISASMALTATDRLGNVKDTIVGAMYKISAINSRGAWAPATAYAIKDLVSNAGIWYLCVVAHTSSAVFLTDEGSKWRVHQGVTGIELEATKHQRPTVGSLPRFMRVIESYRADLRPAINIVGFGSSVGVGATLPDAATQAPSAYFKNKLKVAFDPGDIYNLVLHNDSVNGSALSESLAVLATAVTTHLPKICVLSYGMNDAAVALYNSGQTYPAVYTSIMRFVTDARAAGSDVVLMTTPHCKTSGFVYAMPPATPQVYPTNIAAPVAPEQLEPPASASNITADFLGVGEPITVSHRHLRVNQAMRLAAKDAGVPLIDVERYWFKAVAQYGEGALFDAGETVHPNLFGHQQSYWLAIDDFVESLASQTAQDGGEPRLNGLVGINNATPEAVLDVVPPYLDGAPHPLRIWSRVGAPDGNGIKAAAVVWRVDPANGDLVGYCVRTTDSSLIEVYRHHTEADSGGTVAAKVVISHAYHGAFSKRTMQGTYNSVGIVTLGVLPDNSAGSLIVNGLHPGVGRKRVRMEWVSVAGVVTFGAVDAVGAGVFTGPIATGLTVQVTPFADGANINWEISETSGF